MRREWIIYSAMLLLGLAAAYYVSVPSHSNSPNSIFWVRVSPAKIGRLDYDDEQIQLQVERKGEFFQLSTKKVGEKDSVTEVAQANQAFAKYLESFNPLQVQRHLGRADKFNLADFGLSPVTKRLKVTDVAERAVLNFAVGNRAYGTRQIFALDEERNELLLIGLDVVEELTKPFPRFFEKSLFGKKLADPQHLIVQRGEVAAQFVSVKNQDGLPVWAQKDDPSKLVPEADDFMRQLTKLSVQSYASEEQARILADAQVILFELEITDSKGEKVSIALFKEGTGMEDQYWVKSSRLYTYARVERLAAELLMKTLPILLEK